MAKEQENEAEKKLSNIDDDDDGDDEEEEKWVKHYSSNHQILLVGEGDFSFSLSLAHSFGSASNMVSTSLDSHDELIKKYKKAEQNLEQLRNLGAHLLHKVDATKMRQHVDLNMRKFDRVIFNFPHAGFYGREDNSHLIQMHRTLVNGFFRNASCMLRDSGEIHINHKIKPPFNKWDIVGLASRNSLMVIDTVSFNREDYPGYNNKRGDGPNCDVAFYLGECSTFRFRFFPGAKKVSKLEKKRNQHHKRPTVHHRIPNERQQEPSHTQQNMSDFSQYSGLPLTSMRNCPTISDYNFNHVVETTGRASYEDYPAFGELGISRGHMMELPIERPMIEALGSYERHPINLPRALGRPLVKAPRFERHLVQAPRTLERQMIGATRVFRRPLLEVLTYEDMHVRAHGRPMFEVAGPVERAMIRGPGAFGRPRAEAPMYMQEHIVTSPGAFEAQWTGPRCPTRYILEQPHYLEMRMQEPKTFEWYSVGASRNVERDEYPQHDFHRLRMMESSARESIRRFGSQL